MAQKLLALVALALLGAAFSSSAAASAETRLVAHPLRVSSRQGVLDVTLWVAEGFRIEVFASGLGHARMLAESPSGELIVSEHFEGRVLKLADRDGDGLTEEVIPILTDLNHAHGLAFVGDVLFVAEEHRVLRLDTWWDGTSAREIIRLPADGLHRTRSLAVGPDAKLYVSIGSSCDACTESDPMRAAVWRHNLDGSGGERYAAGLRNAVGLAWDPRGRLWASENERNGLGEDVPPDELNLLRAGADYGWPFCFGERVPDAQLGGGARCPATEPPVAQLPAHAAPLGLAFYDGPQVAPAFRGDLFVALHGSALRQQAVGYSVVRLPFRDGELGSPEEFVRGWLVGETSWGRPVAPFVGGDGSLWLTDDKAGAVYRLRAS